MHIYINTNLDVIFLILENKEVLVLMNIYMKCYMDIDRKTTILFCIVIFIVMVFGV